MMTRARRIRYPHAEGYTVENFVDKDDYVAHYRTQAVFYLMLAALPVVWIINRIRKGADDPVDLTP